MIKHDDENIQESEASSDESALIDAVSALAAQLKVEFKELVTMYALANVLSNHLPTRVREQHMYNYRANDKFKNLVDGKLTSDDAVAFALEFILKRVAK